MLVSIVHSGSLFEIAALYAKFCTTNGTTLLKFLGNEVALLLFNREKKNIIIALVKDF